MKRRREGAYRERAEGGARDIDEVLLDSVLLETTSSPMRAAMVRNILESEGIPVATPGFHVSAATGLNLTFDIQIRVPRDELAHARDVLLERGALSSKITVKTPRRWLFAAAVALVPGFGLGHVHAGAYASAAVLFLAEVVALTVSDRSGVAFAGLTVLFPIAGDLIGSRAACARANASVPTRTWLSGGAMLGAALVPVYLGVMGMWGGAFFAGPSGRTMCEMFARCADRDERACLASYAEAEVDGQSLFSDACVRCVREEHRCSAVLESCSELCGFQ